MLGRVVALMALALPLACLATERKVPIEMGRGLEVKVWRCCRYANAPRCYGRPDRQTFTKPQHLGPWVVTESLAWTPVAWILCKAKLSSRQLCQLASAMWCPVGMVSGGAKRGWG